MQFFPAFFELHFGPVLSQMLRLKGFARLRCLQCVNMGRLKLGPQNTASLDPADARFSV